MPIGNLLQSAAGLPQKYRSKPKEDISQSLGKFAREKLARQNKFDDAILLQKGKFDLQQKLLDQKEKQKQADPMFQLLKQAKIAEAAKTLGNERLFNQVRGRGQFGSVGGQPQQTAQPQQGFGTVQGQQINQGQSQFRPETATLNEFGKLVPGGFKRVVPPEEQQKAIQAKGFEEQQKKRAARTIKIESGARAGISNLELTSGVGRDFANVYADSVKEGGAGGLLQQKLGQFATKIGDLPSGREFGGKFARTGALEGKRNEFLMKMMPMLSQQTEKPEGSVRMITSILEALGQTIPSGNTAPRAAREQIAETMRTFFRFARAAENNRLAFDEQFKGRDINTLFDDKGNPVPEVSNWIINVGRILNRVELAPEEEAQLNSVIGKVVEPIDKILKSKVQQVGRFQIEEE